MKKNHLWIGSLLISLLIFGCAGRSTTTHMNESQNSKISVQQAENDAKAFLTWLETKQSYFGECKTHQDHDVIRLCDGTQLSHKEIQRLFALNTTQLINELQKQNVKIEIVCEQSTDTNCVAESTNPLFKKMGSLHGLYVAKDNTIYIRSGATVGVIIHEYIHNLQSKNTQSVFGRQYKIEKNKVIDQLNILLDDMVLEIKQISKIAQDSKLSQTETDEKTYRMKSLTQDFLRLNDQLMQFSRWQDLIDEREIFKLFIAYEKDWKIAQADMDLVRKNMGFICQRKDLANVIADNECKPFRK
ncbi:MAG: hypothetical protein ACK4VO_13765 [Pseudobdellovibrio sp.]